jgi:hypothetical protein
MRCPHDESEKQRQLEVQGEGKRKGGAPVGRPETTRRGNEGTMGMFQP